jgi:hypothetical protein
MGIRYFTPVFYTFDKTGRRLYWDSDKNKFIGDEEANSYLVPKYRAPWKLPEI